ncbi:MAG: glycine cleavage system aminomethyltransferase GcvT [Lachnospiraceae bacterium]|nr:glycine cleavage system aminomethyltransferase GcvT [Lachnospiraceae bacterium]
MEQLRQTVLNKAHREAGATMVDFGGFDMPVQYPGGILAEHLLCRSRCGIFDVSHMGRWEIGGPQQKEFLNHVLTCRADDLPLGRARYGILCDSEGFVIDDVYLYRFREDRYFLVVNAGNREKDRAHLTREAAAFDVTLTDRSEELASIAVQGPKSREILEELLGGPFGLAKKNDCCLTQLNGKTLGIARTGYTGEPIGFELFCESGEAESLWNGLVALGAGPVGLGARDTLRTEAGYPLYGHEMGDCRLGGQIPACAVPAARFGVSLAPEKGGFIGREALTRQKEALAAPAGSPEAQAVPYRVREIVLTGRGVLRPGCPVLCPETGEVLGYVTSGTVAPYWIFDESGIPGPESGRRSLGMALLKESVLPGSRLTVDIRGRLTEARAAASLLITNCEPYALPVLP